MADVTVPSVTGGVVERHPGGRITCSVKAGESFSGGELVELTGAATGFEVQVAGAESKSVLGVAMYDGDGDNANKDKVTVALAGVWDLKASGSINAGDLVIAAADGDVKAIDAFAATDTQAVILEQFNDLAAVIGIALEDIANTATGAILLRLGGTL